MIVYQAIWGERLEEPGQVSCKVEEGYQEKFGLDPYSTLSGQEVHNWDRDLTFLYSEADGNTFTDVLPNNLGWLLYSQRLKELLEPLTGDHVQFLPCALRDTIVGKERRDYFVANITDVRRALDLDRSEHFYIELDEIKILSVTKHVLIGTSLQGASIFRLEEDINPVFLSEATKELLCSNKVTGYEFFPVAVAD